jgi:hypothetical protein
MTIPAGISPFRSKFSKLGLKRIADSIAFTRIESVEDKFIDVELDVHCTIQSDVSASVRGFSSLAYSIRAAFRMWDIETFFTVIGCHECRIQGHIPDVAAGTPSLESW